MLHWSRHMAEHCRRRNMTVRRDALDYPWTAPDSAFAVSGGDITLMADLPAGVSEDRIAVVGYGANRNPDVLASKLKDCEDQTVFVRPAVLVDVDVVFAGHFTKGGIVPATLSFAGGTRADVSVAFFSEVQIPHIHRSESLGANYTYGRISGGQVEGWNNEIALHAYLAIAGRLTLDGSPVALSAIEAQNRVLPEMSERQLMHRLALSQSFESAEALRESVSNDETLRIRLQEWLAQTAETDSLPGFQEIGE